MQSSSGSPVEGAQVPAPARNGHQPERGERACAECRSEQHMNGWAGKTLQLDVPQPNGPCPKENGSAGPAQQGKGGSDLVPNGHAHAEGAANKCSEAVETPSPPRAHTDPIRAALHDNALAARRTAGPEGATSDVHPCKEAHPAVHPADRAGSTEASEEEPRSGSGSNAGPQQDAADGSGSGLSSTEPCLNGVDVRPGRGASAGEGAAARPAQRRGSAERGILRKSLATSVQREAVKGYLIHRCARMHACSERCLASFLCTVVLAVKTVGIAQAYTAVGPRRAGCPYRTSS